MPLWDKVKQELDRAGHVAQDALDEGRLRLEAHRARQTADKAAEVLGYAVFRAQRAGTPLDDAELARHTSRLGDHEAEVSRLEQELASIQQRWRAGGGMGAPPAAHGGGTGGSSAAPPTGGAPDPGPVGTPSATAAMDMPPESSDAPIPPPVTPPSATAADLESPTTDPWRPGDVPGHEPY